MLGDVLSRASHILNSRDIGSAVIKSIDIEREDYLEGYETDRFSGQLWIAYQNALPDDERSRRKILNIKLMLAKDYRALGYLGPLCVPRKSVLRILEIPHDCIIAGHFGSAKTLSRFRPFYCKQMTCDA